MFNLKNTTIVWATETYKNKVDCEKRIRAIANSWAYTEAEREKFMSNFSIEEVKEELKEEVEEALPLEALQRAVKHHDNNMVFHTAATGALKDLGDKLRIDLIPPVSLEAVAEVLSYGAKKYSDNNWRKGLKHSVHYAAAQRHLNSFWKGIDIDEESGLHHIKHAATNLLMLITNIERTELDDRYKPSS